jgi:hypothetical protein
MIPKSNLDDLRKEAAKFSELWQLDLLNSGQLGSYAKEKGLSWIPEKTIVSLWKTGLLKADIVLGPAKNEKGFCLIKENKSKQGKFIDVRQPNLLKKGYGSYFKTVEKSLENFQPYFHPFRIFVLYYLDKVFKLRVSSWQYPLFSPGYTQLIKRHVRFLDEWTSDKKFSQKIDEINKVAELAIVLEPLSLSKISGRMKWKIPDNEKTFIKKRSELKKIVLAFFSIEDCDWAKAIQKNLCQEAEEVDPNKILHVVIRLMKANHWLKLKGKIGASITFKIMAEIIRRTFEDFFNLRLPEEDELGFGTWMPNARRIIYGSERILDAPKIVRKEFLTSLGLESSTKVKCYVEGETEEGFIEALTEGLDHINIINLKGQFIEKRHLAFADSLRKDKDEQIFSIILLDSDRNDNIRVVTKAAEKEHFVGQFFISNPDFEIGNFKIETLANAILELAEHKDQLNYNFVYSTLLGVQSSEDIFKNLRKAGVKDNSIRKSKDWGKAIGNNFTKEDLKVKPSLKELLEFLINACNANFLETARNCRTNPKTGKLEERKI